jgi:hypothetical protein
VATSGERTDAAHDKFPAFAMHKMNDPDGTSDGQPMDPLGMLLAFLKVLVASKNL